MRFIGVNGINTKGAGNTDLVLHELRARGYETLDLELPVRHTISAFWAARKDARDLILPVLRKNDIIVAHSFGCLRSAHVLRMRGDLKAAFFIAPAMSHKWKFPQPEKVWAFVSTEDWVVDLGDKIPFHPFGHAGVSGFNQLAALRPISHNFHWQSDHDDYFKEPLFTQLVNKIEVLSAS